MTRSSSPDAPDCLKFSSTVLGSHPVLLVAQHPIWKLLLMMAMAQEIPKVPTATWGRLTGEREKRAYTISLYRRVCW